MNEPSISILIPVYQREALIEECVRSALASDYPNFEVVVCDNASTDRTLEICKRIASEDDRLRVFEGETNIGPVNNWRRCAELATGDYVKLLFSDDRVESRFLPEAVEAFRLGDVGIVYSSVNLFGDADALLFGKGTGETQLISTKKFIDEFYRSLGSRNPVSPGCSMMRKTDFLDHLKVQFTYSTFTEFANHGGGPDVALIHAVALNYSHVAHIDKPLNGFRSHSGSFTAADVAGNSNTIWHHQASAALSVAREACGESYFYKAASRIFLREWRHRKLDAVQFASLYGLVCEPRNIKLHRGAAFAVGFLIY
jgi:glycosyltransferase involved in cell wall biosynthesis